MSRKSWTEEVERRRMAIFARPNACDMEYESDSDPDAGKLRQVSYGKNKGRKEDV